MTIRELAKIAKVSPATISLVLNDKPGVGEKKRRQILSLLDDIGFDKEKRRVRCSGNKTLLFIKLVKSGYLVDENAGFIAKIMDSIQAECNGKGYSLQIQVVHGNFDHALAAVEYHKLCGVFVLGTELEVADYSILDHITVPYVVIDNSMSHFDCNSITMNNEEMAYEAVKYLASTNEKRIGYFCGGLTTQNFIERGQGLKKAIEDFGLSYDETTDRFMLVPSISLSYQKMKAYLESGAKVPRLVFSDNDIIAIGAVKAMAEFDIRVPEDVAVFGFDDIYLAQTAAPPLSTFHVYRTLIGKMATMMLLDEIEGDQPACVKIKVGGSMVVRKSTPQ
ncbi:MAG: LacI family DNA-binding transcriptional regulator [Spirochaetia bacterium]|jgi:LacI family transcriptional regulator|nr:LacI family DNA-binding transcriptional regulator [Spirochaetia bacterium]